MCIRDSNNLSLPELITPHSSEGDKADRIIRAVLPPMPDTDVYKRQTQYIPHLVVGRKFSSAFPHIIPHHERELACQGCTLMMGNDVWKGGGKLSPNDQVGEMCIRDRIGSTSHTILAIIVLFLCL